MEEDGEFLRDIREVSCFMFFKPLPVAVHRLDPSIEFIVGYEKPLPSATALGVGKEHP